MLLNKYLHINKMLTCGLFYLILTLGLLFMNGCGTLYFQSGKEFESDLLETTLELNVSNSAQIQTALGPPFGKGRALMPFHDTPQTVWTYYFENGFINIGSMDCEDKRKYLFVFLDEDIYAGYMWFDSLLFTE